MAGKQKPDAANNLEFVASEAPAVGDPLESLAALLIAMSEDQAAEKPATDEN